jgi:hypothetical protein
MMSRAFITGSAFIVSASTGAALLATYMTLPLCRARKRDLEGFPDSSEMLTMALDFPAAGALSADVVVVEDGVLE